jgi:SAM-dependent methyltransferase
LIGQSFALDKSELIVQIQNMIESVNRFTTRVENYLKYRPGYPPQILSLLRTRCELNSQSVIADIGSGTGFLSRVFLENGNHVFGVEPNDAMRLAAEHLLKEYDNFTSVNGQAEQTTLESETVDFVTAGQAFHWFDVKKAKAEFVRILKPGGWVILIWNERRLDSTPFLRAYEELLLEYGTDYQRVRHENVTATVRDFFAPDAMQESHFDNQQLFDFEGLVGRVASSSYAPEPGNPLFVKLSGALRKIFDEHAEDGRVSVDYNTALYYGHLSL